MYNLMDFAGLAGLITAAGTAVAGIIAGLSLNERLKAANRRVDELEAELDEEREHKLNCAQELAAVKGRLEGLQEALERKHLL